MNNSEICKTIIECVLQSDDALDVKILMLRYLFDRLNTEIMLEK